MASYGNDQSPWLYSSCAPYDPPDLTPRGCFDREVRSRSLPLAPMIYGARHSPIFRNGLSGFAGLGGKSFEEQLEHDRFVVTWTGKQHPLSGAFSARLSAAVLHARHGEIERAARAYADAEAMIPEFGDVYGDYYDEAQILLETTQSLFESAKGQVMEFRKAMTQKQGELRQVAIIGSSPEAHAREAKEQADIARAKKYGSWAYGLSALPGGSIAADIAGETQSFVKGPGKWIAGLIALGIGVYAVGRVKSFIP